jgi:hypothetical protein
MDFGIAETGFARGSPPGTTTEVLRVGFPIAEIRVVSHFLHELPSTVSKFYKPSSPYAPDRIRIDAEHEKVVGHHVVGVEHVP